MISTCFGWKLIKPESFYIFYMSSEGDSRVIEPKGNDDSKYVTNEIEASQNQNIGEKNTGSIEINSDNDDEAIHEKDISETISTIYILEPNDAQNVSISDCQNHYSDIDVIKSYFDEENSDKKEDDDGNLDQIQDSDDKKQNTAEEISHELPELTPATETILLSDRSNEEEENSNNQGSRKSPDFEINESIHSSDCYNDQELVTSDEKEPKQEQKAHFLKQLSQNELNSELSMDQSIDSFENFQSQNNDEQKKSFVRTGTNPFITTITNTNFNVFDLRTQEILRKKASLDRTLQQLGVDTDRFDEIHSLKAFLTHIRMTISLAEKEGGFEKTQDGLGGKLTKPLSENTVRRVKNVINEIEEKFNQI